MMACPASNSGAQVLSQDERAVSPAPVLRGRHKVQASRPSDAAAGIDSLRTGWPVLPAIESATIRHG